MVLTVFPLRLIWFQFFFLLIAVATEAYIFSRQIGLGRKKALFYAASINLIAAIIGWTFFFFIVPALPNTLKLQLLSYILFDKLFYQPESSSFHPAIALTFTAIFIFFSGLLLKMRTFQLLQMWLTMPRTPVEARKESTLVAGSVRPPSLTDKAKLALKIIVFGRIASPKKKLIKSKKFPPTNPLSRRRALQAILKAHAASHSAILIVLFLRSQVLNSREKSK